MKKMNRWVYAIIGVIVLLLAGLIYAWSIMSQSIGAAASGLDSSAVIFNLYLSYGFLLCGKSGSGYFI